MIRINKSATVPGILVEKGEQETVILCHFYDSDPFSCDDGTKKFEIKSSIYGHVTVKDQLIFDQHEKCCFCEADFTANGYGDVEHFRPKSGYQTVVKGPLIKPGYYWLAYDWSNLLFSCQVCNTSYKRNYFPIEDETKRAKNHTHNLLLESPMLINPLVDDPEKHIRFNQHVPVAIDDRGEISIKGYGLDREGLNRLREQYYSEINNSITLAKCDLNTLSQEFKDEFSNRSGLPWSELEKIIVKAKSSVLKAAQDNKPYSNMVRSNFPELPTK